jgi:hypothetical protein
LETNGNSGGLKRIVRQNASNAAKIGASIDECAATAMWIRVESTPLSASKRSRASIAATGPDATHREGAFTAAIDSSLVRS